MIEILLLLGVVSIVTMLSIRNKLVGGYCLLSWMRRRISLMKGRGQKAVSEKEQQAIKETLLACERLRNVSFEEWDFKSITLSLIKKIAFIYHPNATAPIEQARLGDVLDALQEAYQKILHVIHLPQVEYVTQFRVIQIFDSYKTSYKNPQKTGSNKSGIKKRLLESLILKWVVRSLLIQWVLLVGEAALEVYGGNQEEGVVEAEAILTELGNLPDASDIPVPENVKTIIDSSKKKIVFSPTVIPWQKLGQIYFMLTEQIARYYHSDSTFPVYEVRVCDLLKSVADSLEGVARLGQKPVLNKILKIRVSTLTQAKDIALPLGQNKILEWVNKYQVGGIAKWSHTLYKTLKKKQPEILLRDVAFGVVKEGGKRWLVLYLHGKVAAEANKLYGPNP
ncbi:hypothetical protein OAT11_01940 [Nitrospinaceae bacterium]|nr:hypothetical protein [Nitrospinaceae bacterium]